jgi:hypothetical protein
VRSSTISVMVMTLSIGITEPGAGAGLGQPQRVTQGSNLHHSMVVDCGAGLQ